MLDVCVYHFSIAQAAVSLWEDDPYGAVISYIPSVIISVEQVIFPGLSFPVVNLLLVGTIALLHCDQGPWP